MFVYLCCRQAPGDAVHMWGKLYWVDDSPASMNHNWHIHENPVSGEGRVCEVSGEGRVCEGEWGG